jgi:uncharacterized coiled-coil protein SlyX
MDNRIEDLEVKVAFLEHHVSELDGVIRQLMDRLETAERQIRELKEERATASVLGSPDEEVPPHHLPR